MKKFFFKIYLWIKSVVAKFRRPMKQHNYHRLSLERKQIYKSIEKSLSEDTNCEVMDFGLSLYIKIFDRGFKIVSQMANNYENLLLTVLEYKETDDAPSIISNFEIQELSIKNEIIIDEKDFSRSKRMSLIGDSPYPIGIDKIGDEFKTHLFEFLSK